ncbi:MAG: hypothetical protein DI555_20800 [Novosphingobium pentaromativorans]|uniref:MobA/MobL protein domain-containing protein n=1 Tax=Novosphingobium pentaromativorans TaxID=205844 RepID=A0A2W5NHY6_9SPHN|nr:MAG: hypothetical protein DI555_20800 [Novosphingobium pentaromativorans]
MRNRWRQPIDLRLPAPLPGRPVAADGKTSFHFRCTSVSKTRDLSTGAAARDGGSNSSAGGANAALNFERYVTADWAREVTPAGFERYLEEPKNERRDDHANVDGGSRAVLVKTNISEIPREREDFWTQAWGAQKTPGSQRLELFIGRGSKDDWRAIADDPEAPDALREAARSIADDSGAPGAPKSRQSKTGRRADATIELVTDAEIAWAIQLQNRFGARRAERMIHYPRPRGGRAQERSELELPVEFSPAEIEATVNSLTELLDSIAAGDEKQPGVRYTIVVHEPDYRNDLRNFHIHLLMYPGCAMQISEGVWSFEGPAGQPAKLRPGQIAVAFGALKASALKTTKHEVLAAADKRALRQRYAAIVNEQLKCSGAKRKFDARTYERMGIDQDPAEHLGPAAASLVAAGVPVAADLRNAVKYWKAARQRLVENDETRQSHLDWQLKHLRSGLKSYSTFDAANNAQLAGLIQQYEELSKQVIEGRRAIDLVDLERAEAESAATRLKTGTARILDAIDDGKAKHSDVRNERYIRNRFARARAHLDEIADAIEPGQEGLEDYRRCVAHLEQQVSEIEAAAQALIKSRGERYNAAWQGGSMLFALGLKEPLLNGDYIAALHEALLPQWQRYAAERDIAPVYVIRGAKADRVSEFELIGLPSLDREVLYRPEFSNLVLPLLNNVADAQRHDVETLVRFVQKFGVAALKLANRKDVKAELEPIKTLYSIYRNHPLLIAAVKAEQDKVRGAASVVNVAGDPSKHHMQSGREADVRAVTYGASARSPDQSSGGLMHAPAPPIVAPVLATAGSLREAPPSPPSALPAFAERKGAVAPASAVTAVEPVNAMGSETDRNPVPVRPEAVPVSDHRADHAAQGSPISKKEARAGGEADQQGVKKDVVQPSIDAGADGVSLPVVASSPSRRASIPGAAQAMQTSAPVPPAVATPTPDRKAAPRIDGPIPDAVTGVEAPPERSVVEPTVARPAPEVVGNQQVVKPSAHTVSAASRAIRPSGEPSVTPNEAVRASQNETSRRIADSDRGAPAPRAAGQQPEKTTGDADLQSGDRPAVKPAQKPTATLRKIARALRPKRNAIGNTVTPNSQAEDPAKQVALDQDPAPILAASDHSPVAASVPVKRIEASEKAARTAPAPVVPARPTARIGKRDELAKILERAMSSPEFSVMSPLDQFHFDTRAHYVIKEVLEGTARIHAIGAQLHMSVGSDDALAKGRKLAATSCGWDLLMEISRMQSSPAQKGSVLGYRRPDDLADADLQAQIAQRMASDRLR